MGLLGTMVVNFTANVSGLKAGVDQAKSSISDLGGTGSKILGAAAGALTVMTGAAIAGGVAATKMAADFQSGMTSLVTGAGESKNNIQMVSNGILDLATKTGTSTQQLTAGMYMIESAGFRGADALNVLKAAAEGAKVGNSDLGTTAQAVTGIMLNYKDSHLTASQAVNTLVATVKNGQTNMQDLSGALANVLPIASKSGVSLTDVAAAMATMTAKTIPAAQASTYLRQTIMAIENPSKKASDTMASLGLKSSDVAAEMKKSLPDALQMITDAAAKKFPVGSAQYIAALSNMMGGSKQLQGVMNLTGADLAIFKSNVDSISGAVKSGGNDIAGWSDVQNTFNQKMSQAKEVLETMGIKIGTALLPAVGKLLDIVMPLITSFGNWISNSGILVTATNMLSGAITNVTNFISNAVKFFQQNHAAMEALRVGAIALAGVIAGLLVAALVVVVGPALVAAGAFLQFAWPFLLIGGAIALVIIYFNQLKAAFGAVGAALGGNAALQGLLKMLQTLGNFLASIFMPLWDYLVNTVWKAQLLPMIKQLWSAISSLSLLWEGLAAIVGVVVVTAIGVLIGIITMLAKGLAYLITGITAVLAGVIQVFTGIVQFIGGIVRVIIDLITGNFSDLGPALYQILQGLYNIFVGLWTAVVGLFTTVFGTIWGLISGFVQGFIGFFISLWDALVGHSIIPDMVNGIISWIAHLVTTVISAIVSFVTNIITWFINLNIRAIQAVVALVTTVWNWFSQLPGKVMSFLSGLPGQIMNLWNKIASDALNAGANIVKNIADGIKNAIHFVSDAIGSVTSWISAHLPHSPAKVGPLRDLQLQGSLIPEQISTGILSNMSKLDQTMNKLPYPGSSATSNSTNAVLAAIASNNNNGNNNNQPIAIYIDGKEVTSRLGPHIANAIRLQGVRSH